MTILATPAAPVDTVNRLRTPLRTASLTHSGVLVLAASGALVGWRRAERPYADGDILWGIRTGVDFLRTGHLAHHNPYSWTAHGASWVQNSWAWNVVLAASYKTGGLLGIALLGVALTMLIAVLIGRLARREGAAEPATGMIVLIIGGLFSVCLTPRPQLADYTAVLVLLLVLPSLYDDAGRPSVRAGAGVLALQVIWMNLHSTALIGPVLILAGGLGRLVGSGPRRRLVATRTATMTALTGIACLATPYGTVAITHVQQVRRASAGLIGEWLPIGIRTPGQWLADVGVLVGALAAVLCWRARRFDTFAILLVLGAASASAIRFAPLLVLAAAPTLAAAFQRLPIRAVMMRRGWVLTAVITAAVCVTGMSTFGQPGRPVDSPALIRALPGHCRLLNDYAIGGAVILRRPDVPVSIDSRNDMYGRARELTWFHVLSYPAAGRRYMAANDVTCVLAPKAAPTVKALMADPSWRVAGDDGYRVLLLPATR